MSDALFFTLLQLLTNSRDATLWGKVKVPQSKIISNISCWFFGAMVRDGNERMNSANATHFYNNINERTEKYFSISRRRNEINKWDEAEKNFDCHLPKRAQCQRAIKKFSFHFIYVFDFNCNRKLHFAIFHVQHFSALRSPSIGSPTRSGLSFACLTWAWHNLWFHSIRTKALFWDAFLTIGLDPGKESKHRQRMKLFIKH
jgi:hypothetical protein